MPTRILIIDDDADIRDILALELRFEHCQIVECDSYASASRCLADHGSYDLIISDMSLGDGNGLQLLRRLRDDFHSTTPFVLMSGDFNLREATVCAAGAAALIAKPFMLPDLVPQIFAWAKSRSAEPTHTYCELKAS